MITRSKDVQKALSAICTSALLLLVTACASQPDERPATAVSSPIPALVAAKTITPPATTEPPPTDMPAATTTPTGMQCIPQLLPVTEDAVSWVQWAEDGTTLYYNLQDDPDAWWAFDPESKTATPLSAKPDLGDAIPDAIAKIIPENVRAESISVSPDVENAVYGVEVYTSPTPTPDTAGESSGPAEFQHELFLVKSGATSPVSLGQFAGLLEGFTWFADSSAFLVHNSAREPGRAYTWLASVSAQTVTPLLAATPDASEKIFVDISEDGLALLYRDRQTLHLYNLSTSTDREILSLPNARFYAWFLDDARILLVDDLEESLHFAAYIYDTATNELNRMSEDTFEADAINLSPTKQYVGIAGTQVHGLKILPICPQIQSTSIPISTTPPLPAAPPPATFNTRHVSTEYLRNVIWSAQEKAFILTTWTEGSGWWALSPDAATLTPHASPVPTLDPATSREIGLYANAAYAISNDGQAALYHRQGDTFFELWHTDLNAHEHYQVMTNTEFYEGGCCIENIVWFHQDEEALLTQVSGESLIVRRLDVATRQVSPWFAGVTTTAATPIEDIVPTIITLAPGERQLAMVSWLMGPQPDQLWILDLVDRELTHIGPAYAGMQPLWSADGRYVYYASGNAPHYFGAYDSENPVGIYKFDRETSQTTELLPPGALGSAEISPQWGISEDENHIIYSADREDEEPEGIWLADLN